MQDITPSFFLFLFFGTYLDLALPRWRLYDILEAGFEEESFDGSWQHMIADGKGKQSDSPMQLTCME